MAKPIPFEIHPSPRRFYRRKADFMNRVTHILLSAVLVSAPALLAGQQTSPQSPQDVPKHQPPGTNNPDISKQRRPAPYSPPKKVPNENSSDVPNQQPGTDNPDVAKQRTGDKVAPTGDSEGGKSGKNSKKKAKSRKSDSRSSQ